MKSLCSNEISNIAIACNDVKAKPPAKKLFRSFGGKINGFKDKEERRFENKHLKAYKKGYSTIEFL